MCAIHGRRMWEANCDTHMDMNTHTCAHIPTNIHTHEYRFLQVYASEMCTKEVSISWLYSENNKTLCMYNVCTRACVCEVVVTNNSNGKR